MIPWIRTRRAGTFEEYRRILEVLFKLSGGTSCIDLGCGEAHVTQHFPNTLLVDLVPRLNPKLPVAQWDMREAPLKLDRQTFDLMLMADSIEHLSKEDGTRLLQGMRFHSKLQVVFVPLGPWKVDSESLHPDSHKSAWHPEEFRDQGWEVWEWPTYHRFEGGEILGAFWAWHGRPNPFVSEVAKLANVEL